MFVGKVKPSKFQVVLLLIFLLRNLKDYWYKFLVYPPVLQVEEVPRCLDYHCYFKLNGMPLKTPCPQSPLQLIRSQSAYPLSSSVTLQYQPGLPLHRITRDSPPRSHHLLQLLFLIQNSKSQIKISLFISCLTKTCNNSHLLCRSCWTSWALNMVHSHVSGQNVYHLLVILHQGEEVTSEYDTTLNLSVCCLSFEYVKCFHTNYIKLWFIKLYQQFKEVCIMRLSIPQGKSKSTSLTSK